MIRQLIFIGLVAVSALPAGAAKKVTVAQLGQTLTADSASHKSDREIAREMGEMELSERLTEATLSRLKAQLAPGSAAALALQLLADQSAFLDPPASEIPADPAPGEAAQQQMLVAARAYVAQVLPRLPNLLSIRTINRNDDSPQALTPGGWPVRAGLHRVDTSKREISSLDERENQPPTQGSAVWREEFGLISGGEFGNTLGMVMTDTLQGEVTWSHWEQTPAGQVAVFRYSVPRTASHFEVIGSREKTEAVGFGSVTRGSALSRRGIQPGDPSNTTMVRTRPRYHGTFSIDPTTGTIFRITMEAEAKDGAPFKQAGILVQYGQVQIGDKQFICPIRSLALSVAVPDPQAISGDAPTQWLNETLFTGYRRFATTTRILPDTQETQSAKPESPSEAPQVAPQKQDETASAPGKTLARSDLAGSSAPLKPSTESDAIGSAQTESIPTESVPAVSAPTVSSPNVPSPAASAPTVAAAEHANEPRASGDTIEMNVNRALVPVVVRDKAGRIVTDLKMEDFLVFDNDQPHPISSFTVERREAAQTKIVKNAVEAEAAPASFPAPPSSGASSSAPNRFTVFLFDDMHVTFEDLAYAQKAAIKAVDAALTGGDTAIVLSTSGKANSGLTRDRAKLQAAIMSLQPRGIAQHNSVACPKLDYYQADLIENKHNGPATQDAVAQVMVCNPGMPQSEAESIAQAAARVILADNRQDILNTYATIAEFVRRVATLPGQRTMILVSSGLVTIDPEALAAESRLIDLAARANLTISALDARGVYTAEITASDDMQGRNPVTNTQFRRGAGLLAGTALQALADGTGGTYFHNSNDLDSGLKSLVEGPEVVYLLELSLDNEKPDGKFHRLKVKVDRDGVQVQARSGYSLLRPEKSKKK
ncbi:MAG: VWA domain-containing protein [Terracidiphilus sp.]